MPDLNTLLDQIMIEAFVSLTMHVRREPYVWDDVLHPIFQMNLPVGYCRYCKSSSGRTLEQVQWRYRP